MENTTAFENLQNLKAAIDIVSAEVNKRLPISISERTPEVDSYLGFAEGRWWSVWRGDIDGIRDGYSLNFTHWMPLPPKPE